MGGERDEKFGSRHVPIGAPLGAKRLAYNLTELAPGRRAFPYDVHHVIEEMFLVIAGTGEPRWPGGTHALKPMDIISTFQRVRLQERRGGVIGDGPLFLPNLIGGDELPHGAAQADDVDLAGLVLSERGDLREAVRRVERLLPVPVVGDASAARVPETPEQGRAEVGVVLEPAHLLRSSKNAARLASALERAHSGKPASTSLDALRRRLGLEDKKA